MSATLEMVGVSVLGKQLGCRTVFVWAVDMKDSMLQGAAAVAVVGRTVVAPVGVAVVPDGMGHHNSAVAGTVVDFGSAAVEQAQPEHQSFGTEMEVGQRQ